MEPKLLPDEDVVIYVAGASAPGQDGTAYLSFSGIHRVKLKKTATGLWKFPAGFVDRFVPKFDDYSLIRLPKPVAWAKIASLDSFTEELIALHDTRESQVSDREVKVDGNANLMVRSDYTLNDESRKTYLTVGFNDGTVQAWGGDGKEIAVPTPTLFLTSSPDDGLVLTLNHGDIGHSIRIECSKDLVGWTNFQTFVTEQYVTRLSVTLSSSNPPSCFFRISK